MSKAEKILRDMLSAVPDSYQKTIGYPTYDWLAGASIPLAQISADLDEAKGKLDPANLTGEELDRYIFPRMGLRRTPATYAHGEVTVTGSGEVPEGTLFESAGGIQYASTAAASVQGTAKIPVRCTIPGAAGNLPAQAVNLMPIHVSGILSAVNEAPMTEGYEAETDQAYYQRFLLRLQTPPTSGNQYHYLNWAMEVSGVGGVQIYPLDKGPNTVGVVLIDQFGKPASVELVEQVQKHIDPDSLGVGAGEAPIGAYCTVSAAAELSIELSVTVTISPDTDQGTVTKAIQDVVTAFLKDEALAAFRPKPGGSQGYRVSYARLGAVILDVPGVDDYTGLTLNGGAASVTVAAKSAAVLGKAVIQYGG